MPKAKTKAKTKAKKPYRYAGGKWWDDDFTLGGVNPDKAQAVGKERGFEKYHSVQFLRRAAKRGWRHGMRPAPNKSMLPGEVQYAFDGRDNSLVDAIEVLNRWAQDMTAWAKAVREDVQRLEDECGLERGDPGDPPPTPWK